MLEEQEEGGGQGQGQGQGEGKDITEQILALLRIRDSQKEIIAKTKVADSGNFQAQREKWTDTLADQQQELMLDLTDVQIELAEETLNPLFDDAHTAMYNSSAGLEQGKSGETNRKRPSRIQGNRYRPHQRTDRVNLFRTVEWTRRKHERHAIAHAANGATTRSGARTSCRNDPRAKDQAKEERPTGYPPTSGERTWTCKEMAEKSKPVGRGLPLTTSGI